LEHLGETHCVLQIRGKHESLSVRGQLQVVFHDQPVSLAGVDDSGKLSA
jgi:hypothetical protein